MVSHRIDVTADNRTPHRVHFSFGPSESDASVATWTIDGHSLRSVALLRHGCRWALSAGHEDFKHHAAIKLVLPRNLHIERRVRRLGTVDVGEKSQPVIALLSPGRCKGKVNVVILLEKDRSAWMADVPSSLLLSSLTLAGTHESCSLYGWPLSVCNTTSLRTQLEQGVRFVDLRLSLPNGPHGPLKAYHGVQPEFADFPTMLVQIYGFLDDRPSEAIIVSVKQEDKTEGFEEAVYAEILKTEHRWWLAPTMPSLGEVRGKAVMFSRFGQRSSNGIHLPIWPDNNRDIWRTSAAGVDVAVQDWYDIGNIAHLPEKAKLVLSSLEAAAVPPEASTTWLISFLSASAIWLAFPKICAEGCGMGVEGVNDRVVRWLMEPVHTEAGPQRRKVKSAAVLCDFFDYPNNALVPLLIDCNF